MVAFIITGGLLLALWGVVSLIRVSPNRLMNITVPYSIAAREILGVPGRKIMGVVIIGASFGFTNALLSSVSAIINEAARIGNSRQADIISKIWKILPLIIQKKYP